MQTKFKIGDRVHVNYQEVDCEAVVARVNAIGRPLYVQLKNGGWEDTAYNLPILKGYEGFWSVEGATAQHQIRLLGKSDTKETSSKFILQYGKDNEFETFSSEKELRAFITKEAKDFDINDETLRVYDIKKVRTVTLGVKITIK